MPKAAAKAATDVERPVGFVNFDGTTGDNAEVEIRVPFDDIPRIRRGQYVVIGTDSAGEGYLGRIVRGPFYTPDAVGRDSAFARASILHGNEVAFLPDYHGICAIEVLGKIALDSSSLSASFARPFPKTQVYTLPPDRIGRLLNLGGNMYLGRLTGYEQVKVFFDGHDKRVLPRNLGIFGTVGSGKTNTAQVLIEEAVTTGYAVVVLDVEGEYISMDCENQEAKKSRRLQDIMRSFGVTPRGIDDLKVFRCPGTESKRKDAKEFCLSFGNLSPYALSEIMGLNEAQEMRFLELYEDCVRDVEQLRVRKPKRGKASKWDRLKGEPILGEDVIPELSLEMLRSKIKDKLDNATGSGDRASWNKVRQLLAKLQRYGIFRTEGYFLNVKDLLRAGQVSVFDLSDSTNVRINNIVIAEILRTIFAEKVDNPDSPPTLIVIEEAHTFVSRENASRMESTLDMLREISRRGRKRWLSLCFISQQPAHLPDEIYELSNSKVVHQTTGKRNLEALRASAGSVNEGLWGDVPILGQGRCIVISPQFMHPVMCDVRPCCTNREYTD
jgi:DNA helicase HerA-like ATPase